MAADLETLIGEIKALPPEDRKRLRESLEETTPPSVATDEISAEEELKLRLFEAGIIKEIKRPERDLQKAQEAFLSYQPIAIRGKPLSETIIEERR